MPRITNKDTQIKLADGFIKYGGNAEQAVIFAGYSPRTARGRATALIANDGVQRLIRERNVEIHSDDIADAKEINAFWTQIIRNKNEETKDRLKASELRAKAAGMFTDNLRLSGSIDTGAHALDAILDQLYGDPICQEKD